MNWKRILLGGVVAGILLNITELATAVLLREKYLAAMRALGHEAAVGGLALLAGLLITCGIGIFAIWLYAAIRPRYGPGIKTAVIAGGATWLIQGSSNLRYLTLGLFPPNLVLAAGGIALVEFLFATLLGSWLYRETPRTALG
jgi:hypothetical protein